MDYKQLVLDNEAIIADLPSEIQQSAGSQLVRSLPQLHAESTRFAIRQTKRPDADTAQAQLVLARAGFDLTREKRNLDRIDLSSAYEDFDSSSEHNLERFLEYQHAMLVNSIIEENNNDMANVVRRNCETQLENDWQKQKLRLLRNLRPNFADCIDNDDDEHRAADTTQSVSHHELSATNARIREKDGILSTPRRKSGAPDHSKERRYAEAVTQFVQQRGHSAELFSQASTSIDEHSGQSGVSKITGVWKLIAQFSYATFSYASCPAPVSVLLAASITFLSCQFTDWLKEHLKRIRLGGRLGFAHQVRAFLREALFRQRFPAFLNASVCVEKVPLWPQLFYCMRCAQLDVTIDVAQTALQYHAENEPLRVFVNALSYFVQGHQLPSNVQNELRATYNTFVRNSQDPFEIAVYNIVARGSLEQYATMKYREDTHNRQLFHQYIASSHHDYMWLELNLLDYDASPDRLVEFQNKIRSFEQHFSQNQSDPPVYFLVLLLSLQFEAAVRYLLSTATYHVEAVHFAIALDEIALLRNENSTNSALSSPIDDIIGPYVFESSSFSPPLALAYVLLLREQHTQQFENRMVELLVGNRTAMLQVAVVHHLVDAEHGIAYEFIEAEKLKKLCMRAAKKAFKDEALLVASELYAVAEDKPQDNLARTLVVLLARHLSNVSNPIRRHACERVKTLVAESSSLNAQTIEALEALYELIEFFNANATIRFDDALEIATFSPARANSGIIPLNDDDIDSAVKRVAYLDQYTAGAISRIFPDVSSICMKILYNRFEHANTQDDRSIPVMREIRSQAQALHTFYLKLESKGAVGVYPEAFGQFYRRISL